MKLNKKADASKNNVKKTRVVDKSKKTASMEMGDFVYSTDVDEMIEDVNSADSMLTKGDDFISTLGENLLLILPGTKKTSGKTLIGRMIHGFKSYPCARTKKSDRFETCKECNDWFIKRTPKSDRVDGEESKNPYDKLYPNNRYFTQVVNITPFCEHETKRNKKTGTVEEKLAGTGIDMDRVKSKKCFMDGSVLDIESDDCKTCFAFNSCFQGPQFLGIANKFVTDFLAKQKRVGQKGTVKIGGKEVKVRGNITLAWTILYKKHVDDAKSIAKKVSYPLIFTKAVDPSKPKQFGTSYSTDFSREVFLIPERWQENILARAKDLSLYKAPCTFEESGKYLEEFLKDAAAFGASGTTSGNPDCFGDKDTKDGEDCTGPGCPVYDTCCKKEKNKDQDKKKSGSGHKKTKQQDALDRISDDEDVDDAIIAKLRKKVNKSK